MCGVLGVIWVDFGWLVGRIAAVVCTRRCFWVLTGVNDEAMSVKLDAMLPSDRKVAVSKLVLPWCWPVGILSCHGEAVRGWRVEGIRGYCVETGVAKSGAFYAFDKEWCKVRIFRKLTEGELYGG